MSEKWWSQIPWRMIQQNMRETDWADISAETYASQLKSFGATVALVNVGGILANYPSQVEDHTVNPYLTGDSLKDVIDACHREGIRVMARVDYSKIRRPVYEKHPDWAYRTPSGDIVDYNGNIHACICGGFQQQKAFEITEEIIRTFPIDGIFVNMGGFSTKDYSYRIHGICHCENCKQKFREFSGHSLPDREDMLDPVYRKYKEFQGHIVRENLHAMRDLIRRLNPDIAIDGLDFQRLESLTEYKRPDLSWPFESSSMVRGIQCLQPGKRCSNPSTEFVGYFYRHIAVSPWQQELRLWQTLANFGGMDYYIMGRLDNHEDRSGYEAVKRVFSFHREHWDFFRDMRVDGEALLLRSGGYQKSDEGRGWVRALTENHILFCEGEPGMIRDLDTIKSYRAVIVADIDTLSRETVQILDDYAAQGGCLILTGDSGKYQQDGTENNVLPFASLEHAKICAVRDDMVSAMLKLREEERALFQQMQNRDLFFFGDTYRFTEMPQDAQALLRLIPPHPYGPPERCYYSQVTELPGLIMRRHGQGKAVFIPWKPGELYFNEGFDNTFAFLQGVMEGIAGLKSVAEKHFTGMAEVICGSRADGQLIQIVNASGSFSHSFLPPIPLTELSLCVPCERKPRRVLRLSDQAEVPFQWENGKLRLTADCPAFYQGYYAVQ